MRLLREAARTGNLDVIREVVQRLRNLKRAFDSLDAVDGDGVTALHMAVMNGQVECVKELLKIGCSPQIPCNGTPILQLALIYATLPHLCDKMMEIINELCKFGAPLTMKDSEDRTIFHLMARSVVSQSIMAYCISLEKLNGGIPYIAGFTPYSRLRDYLLIQKDIVGDTAFHVAARFGTVKNLQQLIENCTKGLVPSLINNVNEDGDSPLHLAAMHNHIKTATLLVTIHPGCFLMRNKTGKTALQIAQECGYQEFVRFFTGSCGNAVSLGPGSRQQSLPTLILTSKAFRRHKTSPEGMDVRALPPENNRRWSVLADRNLGILRANEFKDLKWKTDLVPAKLVDILKVHSFLYFSKIKTKCMSLEDDNSEVSHLDGDTAISHGTFHCAMLAAGAVCQAVDVIMNNQAKNAFCVVRPPGHHAGYRGNVPNSNTLTRSNGFCIFNNVAIGAAYAMDVYRHKGIEKVAILDFDVHHGNGTEECVMNTTEHQERESHTLLEGGEMVHVKKACVPWLDEDDWQNILFASVQGYGHHGEEECGWFYPGSGDTKDTGFKQDNDSFMVIDTEDQGRPCLPSNQETFLETDLSPRIITVGISGPGSKVESWKRSWRDKILPEVAKFNPDLILISAGFDAHKKDDINGGFVALETHHYEWLTEKLVEVANKCCSGRMVSVLEGGYAVQGGMSSAFASSVASHVRALNSRSIKEWNTEQEQLERKLSNNEAVTKLKENGFKRNHQTLNDQSQMEIDDQVMTDRQANFEVMNGYGAGHNSTELGPSRSKRIRANVDYVALNKVLEEEERHLSVRGTSTEF